jgi:alpha-1,3-rhamnosyl/mannosyltransferase
MRYCLDIRTATDHFPGIGRYASNLARAMVAELQAGEELLLLVDSSRPCPWQLPAANQKVTYLETAVSPFSLAQQWQIPKLLRPYQPALYHSPYYLMPYRVSSPKIVTFYDLIPQRFPGYVSARARLLFQIATRLALKQAQHVITISEAARQDLLAAYHYNGEVTAVPLAPDDRFCPQALAEIGRIRQQYQLPEAYALYLGINKPHKNLARLVEVWAQIVADQANPPLLVIAGAWDKRYPEVKQKVAALNLGDAIRFLGPVVDADLPALYSGAFFFIFPSLYEGFGLPVIEAMACGTAVITSHVSSLPEVAGDAALYVNPHDTADITRQINRLLDDPALVAEYQQKSLAQAQKLTWKETAVSTLNIYRQAVR